MLRALLFAAVFAIAIAPAAGADAGYPREHIYDTAVGPDEALVNVSLANHRWPDCTTLESAIEDIFRLEGVADRSKTPDQARALALWKWFRILVSATGGAYDYEGTPGRERPVFEPHKIFAVYGHHQCDGLSWAMVPLWRAAGYMAFDAAHHGHTTASLRYRDADGVMRYHSFDAQHRNFYWDPGRRRVATRTFPLMTGVVHRHVLAPQRLHSLRTSLRMGESVERRWHNSGRVVPSGKFGRPVRGRYYVYRPGRTKGVYAVSGEQVQTLTASTDPRQFQGQLYSGSANAACSPPRPGSARLHPAAAGKTAYLVYRLAPPFVVVDATIEAELLSVRPDDVCRIAVSRDGAAWKNVFNKTAPGKESVEIDLGREARKAGRTDVYTAYNVFIRLELKTAGSVRSVGCNRLKLTAYRMFNKRTQPNLRPGENVFRVTADRFAPGRLLELRLKYQFKGEDKESTHRISKFPYYFRVDVPGWKLRDIRNYDQDFNNEEARMVGYSLALLPDETRAPVTTKGLDPAAAAAKFKLASPHPADLIRHCKPKALETDPIQTNGFFPQSRVRKKADENMQKLIAQLKGSADRSYEAWHAAQQLGDYPEAVDVLCERLKTSNLDLTLFICKALAQIADPKSFEPLLAKWRKAPRGAPGTRYIPDCLAAIGDRRAVKPMVAKLRSVRFDFRFHIAHALGILGGPDAEKALTDLAANDPFPAIREEAREALKRLRK